MPAVLRPLNVRPSLLNVRVSTNPVGHRSSPRGTGLEAHDHVPITGGAFDPGGGVQCNGWPAVNSTLPVTDQFQTPSTPSQSSERCCCGASRGRLSATAAAASASRCASVG